MSKRWKIFWIIWLACLAPVLYSLMYDGGANLTGGKSIARIEKIEGNVTVRSERQMIWKKALTAQDLYNNDLISTEAKSRVTIVFEGGRKLQLNPGSVVKLGLPSPLSKDHEVSVLKGRLEVKAEELAVDEKTGKKTKSDDDSARLILKTTTEKIVTTASKPQTIDVAPKSVQKSVADAATSLEALKNINLNDSMKLSALTPSQEICTPPPLPVVEAEGLDKAAEKASLPTFDAGLLPQIQPLSGEFWTAEPMKKVIDQALRLDVDQPNKMPKDMKDKWKGIVYISGPHGHIRIDGKVAGGRKKLSITLKSLIDAKVIQDLNQASFAVNAGYAVESESFTDSIEHNAPTTGVFSLRSLADGEGIMIGFNKLQSQNSSAPWYFVTPQANKRIWIGVTEPEDRKKLFGIVQGNNGEVSRTDWPGIPAQGAFIVRNDKIIGIVNGRDINAAEWERIRTLFNADLIFKGSSESFISRTGFDVNKTNERTLFALRGGEFVEIDVSLLRTRPSTMRFVQGLSTFLFREQPQILSQAQ